ncbi:MAG: FkbM family methyltransferase [Nitrosomonadales bacterium]|nr:FkbM family methyltransferase [Nitrosomonadales bacterium]
MDALQANLMQQADLARAQGIAISLHDAYIELRKRDAVVRMNRQHAVYLRGMLLRFDYYFSAVEPDLDGTLAVADYSVPRHHRLSGFDDFPAFFHSYPEPMRSTEAYLDFAGIRPGHVVLDLGAYAGMASILFSKQVGASGLVVSFEPDPHNFAAARMNTGMHAQVSGLNNIRLHQRAVWNDCNGLEFSCDGNMGSSASRIVGKRGQVRQVETTTLANILDEEGLERIDFIKVDIEGAEIAVFEQALDLLGSMRPAIVMESHRVNNVHSATECERLLRSIGYETWTSTGNDQFSDYLLFAR